MKHLILIPLFVLIVLSNASAQALQKPYTGATAKVLLDASKSRTAFYRMENDAHLEINITNAMQQTLQNASLRLEINPQAASRVSLPELASGKSTLVQVPINTRWRPDRYTGIITVEDGQMKPLSDPYQLSLTIVPRPLPHQMPVILAGSAKNKQEVKDIGFTHVMLYPSRPAFDTLLKMQMSGIVSGGIASLKNADPKKQYGRVDRMGKSYPRYNLDGLYPQVQQFAYDRGVSLAEKFGDMPAFVGLNMNSEKRDGTQPSFNEIDTKTYREFSGQKIPGEIKGARGVSYHTLKNFPKDRIIADNNPILQYYRWFWKEGDGWNTLNNKFNEGLKTTIPEKDFQTFYAPAVRAASIYGSGGDVDYLNQWTYSYPDPLKIGLACDELFAMAGGHPGQQVVNMTQIIWYRSKTTKKPVPGKEAPWEKEHPDAKFITIAPDSLSEALWLELSRPVQGITYLGWGSLVKITDHQHEGIQMTNPQTRIRLTELLHNVVQPLGPTLKQVPDVKPNVAFLESFASQMFARRGTYGWGDGWGADSYMIARYAGLQPQIIYDETIDQKGLDQYKVLFLTDCDVLTQSVADAIHTFQRRGGIVIGDDHLAPAIQPDILLSTYKRSAVADQDKAALLKEAARLRTQLDAFYQRAVESSNPEVMVRRRRFDNSDYIFVANDHRTYGDYVGQYKLVMEKGLPSQTQITLNRKTGFVYDLIHHQQVQTQLVNGKVLFPVELGAGEGNVFLVTDKPVGKLQLTAPANVQRGESIALKVLLPDSIGQPLDAVVPLQVTIKDSNGRVAEKSGYYGAAHGQLNLTLNIAPNDAPGKWHVEVREGIAGLTADAGFVVQ